MEQAYAAKRELEKWVRRAEGDNVVANRFKDMPKIMSYTDKMRREHDRKMQAEALRQKYRKAPKDGVAFTTMVCLLHSHLCLSCSSCLCRQLIFSLGLLPLAP